MAVVGRRRGSLVTVRSGPRRLTEWISSATALTAYATVAAGTKVLSQSFAAAGNEDLVPATIVRTRGILSVQSDQGGALEEVVGAMGMMIVTEQAAVAGIASIPGPFVQASFGEWFVWVPFMTTSISNASNASRNFEIDSKAMRKFESGMRIVTVVENASPTFGLEFFIQFRMLLKLH